MLPRELGQRCVAWRDATGSRAAAERLSPGSKAWIVSRRAQLVDGVPYASRLSVTAFATRHGLITQPTTPPGHVRRAFGRRPFSALGFITQGSALRAREQFCPVSALGLLTRLGHTSAPTARRLHPLARIQPAATHLHPPWKEKRPEARGPEALVSCGCPQVW